ncbi:MAG TPA: PASTA domain-containing protein [Micromonosporaceae bacterium]|nr:PASTA domain-containing protein [Micromonosporaceae bacterium]
MAQTYEQTEQPPRRRPGIVAAVIVGVLVLAVVGGAVGWLAAGDATDVADPVGTSAPPTVEPTAPTAAPTSSQPTAASAAPSGQPTGTFALPDVTGLDFQQARRQLRDLKLGVQLVFASEGEDTKVDRTEPAAGVTVQRGVTVKIYVSGRAPLATVPGVAGLACTDAAAIVVDHGLFPRYPTGRLGTVWDQDPEPGTGTLRWNDQVTLWCAVASPTATAG